jgi:hypothetical protein
VGTTLRSFRVRLDQIPTRSPYFAPAASVRVIVTDAMPIGCRRRRRPSASSPCTAERLNATGSHGLHLFLYPAEAALEISLATRSGSSSQGK